MTGISVTRAMGVVWIVTSLLWAGLSIMGIFFVTNWLENTQVNLDNSLALVGKNLDSVHILVIEATDVVSSTHQSLTSVQSSVHDVSLALADLRPLLWKTTKVVTLDIPDALDGMQDSMPSLIETAKSVDETLTWLSNFAFTIPNPFGPNWSYDLGISYNPQVPLDQALEGMSHSLVDVPEDLRDLDESLTSADSNLLIVSDDLAYLAGDIDTANQQVRDIVPQLMSLANNIEDVQAAIQETQTSIPESFKKAQILLLAILGLIILTQIPSLYMGIILASGALVPSRPPEEYDNVH